MVYFSIVLPLYNKQNCIVKTLNSVISQDYDCYEVIIVNDGSTDNSLNVVDDWLNSIPGFMAKRFKIVSQENSGVSSARNRGVQEADFDFIAFLDSDDYWESGHLAELCLLVNNYSEKVDVFSSYCIQKRTDKIYPKLGRYSNYNGVLDFFKVSHISNGFIHSSSCCVKKSLALEKPFPAGMRNFEDIVTWARWTAKNGFAFSSNPTAVYVLDNAQASSNVNWDNFIRFKDLIIKECDRNLFYLYGYLFRFVFMHGLYIKSISPFNVYLDNFLKVSKESWFLSTPLALTFIFPKFIIMAIKDIRKN